MMSQPLRIEFRFSPAAVEAFAWRGSILVAVGVADSRPLAVRDLRSAMVGR